VALPAEISERLSILCDTTIEGEPENVRSLIGEMSREELEAVLAEAVTELVDASFRAEKEIERTPAAAREAPQSVVSRPGSGPGRSRTSARRFEVCRSIH
jgi:hypothetical protein